MRRLQVESPSAGSASVRPSDSSGIALSLRSSGIGCVLPQPSGFPGSPWRTQSPQLSTLASCFMKQGATYVRSLAFEAFEDTESTAVIAGLLHCEARRDPFRGPCFGSLPTSAVVLRGRYGQLIGSVWTPHLTRVSSSGRLVRHSPDLSSSVIVSALPATDTAMSLCQ